jgi:protein arginine kinase activator
VTWERVQGSRKLGCSECYTVFNREIQSLLDQEPKNYRGKYPKRLANFKTFLVDVLKLKEGLKDALQKEDYESAARLRDQDPGKSRIPE